jgi:hypothetical protein
MQQVVWPTATWPNENKISYGYRRRASSLSTLNYLSRRAFSEVRLTLNLVFKAVAINCIVRLGVAI